MKRSNDLETQKSENTVFQTRDLVEEESIGTKPIFLNRKEQSRG
jgi:hypothetical protein